MLLKEQEELAFKEIGELQEKLDEELEKGILAEKHYEELEQDYRKLGEEFEEEVNDYEAKIKELNDQLKNIGDLEQDITSKNSVSNPEYQAEIQKLRDEINSKDQDISSLQKQLSGAPN